MRGLLLDWRTTVHSIKNGKWFFMSYYSWKGQVGGQTSGYGGQEVTETHIRHWFRIWVGLYGRSVTDSRISQCIPWSCTLCIDSKSQCFRILVEWAIGVGTLCAFLVQRFCVGDSSLDQWPLTLVTYTWGAFKSDSGPHLQWFWLHGSVWRPGISNC